MAMRCSIPVLLAFLLVLLAPAVVAVTTADIDAQIANVERGHSDDASRRSLIALYQQARSYLDDAAASGEARERFRSAAAKANGTLRELASERRTLERALGGAPLSAAERRLDMVALEAQLEAAKTERALADDRLRGFDLRLQEAQGRPAAIPAERTALATRIGELEQELGEDAAASTDELGRARRALAEAELVAKQAALDALNEEQASYAQRLEVLQARRAVAELKLQLETQRNTALEEHLLALREEQARLLQADVAATSTGNGADAALRRLARDNVALGAEMSRIIAEQARINAERGADQARRERLAAEFDTARGRVDVAGGSASIGRLLVEQRRKLPAPRELLLRGRAIDDAVTRIVLRRIEIEDQRRPLARPAADGDEKTRQRLDRQHQELLAALDDGYVSYLRALAAAEVELQRLQETTTRFAAFLDQHLLWLPNAPRLGAQFARDLWASLRWFASPGTWRDAGGDILAALAREVLWLPAALVALALAVTGRRRFRQHLHEYAVSVRQRLNDRVRNTAFALLATTLLALPLPLACWLLAMLLARHGGDGQFAGVLAQGLFHAASLGLTCLWWHAALWRDGLAVAHFGWNPDGARRLRAALGSFTAVFVPAFALATMFEWQGSAFLQHGFGRLAFALAMLAAAAFGRWLLGGRGPIGREFQLAPGGLVERSRRVWSAVLIFLPVLFLLLSAFGYHYTALELGRLEGSIGRQRPAQWLDVPPSMRCRLVST